MPIDVDTPGSPGWWLQELAWKLERRQNRLARLDAYFSGDPPLPEGAENMRDAYRAFQQKARTNFAELIVSAVRERMQVVGFRTAASDDENGDRAAREIWEANSLDVEIADVFEAMLSLGDGYVIVGKDGDEPVITGEDPRQVVTAHDPVRQRVVRAALKVFADELEGVELAYLYLPGRVLVASRQVKRTSRLVRPRVRFNPTAWEWDRERSGVLPFDQVPVVRFRNRRGVGEFEPHLDLLDRVNHQILQRMVIATMQAFRQRAVKNAPMVDEDGNEVDWEGLLVADPGAVWAIPGDVDMWESGQVDLTPILSAVKDDVQHLSAVTRTPFHMLTPEGANQSAEGAAVAREGLEFKAGDRIARATEACKDVMSLAFRVVGDDERADRSQLEVLWRDVARRSLAELADAAVKKQAAGVPWRQNMVDLGYPPAVIDRMESERADDALLGLLASNTVDQQLPVEGQEPAGSTLGEDADVLAKQAVALGQLIRAGVDPADAARRVGLSGLQFSNLVPVSLRDPEDEERRQALRRRADAG